MKKTLLTLAIASSAIASVANAGAIKGINSDAAFRNAVAEANGNPDITRLVFKKNAHITLSAPVIYNGVQPLTIVGKNATIEGSKAGSFELVVDDEGFEAAVTEDASLVFNTAADLSIRDLSIKNSATRGLVVNIPDTAEGDDIEINLRRVSITDSALYGLHIDDNADEFDDGTDGSAIGIDLSIYASRFIGNGTGALDFDGVRVDERAEGDISSWIVNTQIDANGGDGIELDEAGPGDVFSTMMGVSLSDNGFYNEEDLDDGFDIDEADEGSVYATLYRVGVNNNKDEGLDFDEAGEGDIDLRIRHLVAINNNDEAIKADEEDEGDLRATLGKVEVSDSGDDGIQFTELGEGTIAGMLNKVSVSNSAKYGIKAEQWIVEDEAEILEPAGFLKVRKTELDGNDKGDEIEVRNVIVK